MGDSLQARFQVLGMWVDFAMYRPYCIRFAATRAHGVAAFTATKKCENLLPHKGTLQSGQAWDESHSPY